MGTEQSRRKSAVPIQNVPVEIGLIAMPVEAIQLTISIKELQSLRAPTLLHPAVPESSVLGHRYTCFDNMFAYT